MSALSNEANEHWLKALVRDVLDFPEPGVIYKDITPILLKPGALKKAAHELVEICATTQVDLVAGIESRGFFLAPLVADILDVGVLVVRKQGKLPAETLQMEYELEYGKDILEVHKDQITEGAQVLILDDVLATGGTAKASAQLIQKAGAQVAGFGFLIQLPALKGHSKLEEVTSNIFSLISY